MNITLTKKKGSALTPKLALDIGTKIGELHYRLKRGRLDPNSVNILLQWAVEGLGPQEQVSLAVVETPFVSSFKHLHDITLCAHGKVPRASLFRDTSIVPSEWRDRDLGNGDHLGHFDSDMCPSATATSARTLVTKRQMTFLAMAKAIVGEGTFAEVSCRIIEHKLDITAAQFENLVYRANSEGLLMTDGSFNFAFTKTGKQLYNERGGIYPEIAVLKACRRDSGQWFVRVDRLDFTRGWYAGGGLVLGN